MKYEAVFGDQSLFFDAHRDCEIVGNGHHKVDCGKLMVWNFSEKCWSESYTNEITIAAMRRIIADPKRWTVEDQEAGRLPDIGAKVDGGKVVFVNGFNVVTELKSGAVIVSSPKTFLNTFNPIETPDEKAQRLRDEWRIKALSSASILSGMQEYELKRLGGYIGDIYDALLSGELTMPSKDGE